MWLNRSIGQYWFGHKLRDSWARVLSMGHLLASEAHLWRTSARGTMFARFAVRRQLNGLCCKKPASELSHVLL